MAQPFTDPDKIRLETGSVTDAHHDFGSKSTEPKNAAAIRTGLPFGKGIGHTNEIGILTDILTNAFLPLTVRTGAGIVNNMKLEYGLNETTYKIECFRNVLAMQDPFDMTNNQQKYTVKQWKDYFGGKEKNVYLLFDAANVSILDYLNTATADGTRLHVYVIINRENVNDCATKIYEAPRSTDNGVSIEFLFDAEETPISYIHSEVGRMPLERSSFCSTHDIILGPLQETGRLPTTELKIYDQGKQLLHHSNNPNTTNNITECLKRVTDLLKNLNPLNSKRVGATFQCKRSGDWLQAISCLDTGRKYVNKDKMPHSIDGPIILVSHDQILVWFALYVGVPVLFTQIEPRSAANPDASKRYITLYMPLKFMETAQARIDRLAAEASEQAVKYKQIRDDIELLYNTQSATINTYQTEIVSLFDATLKAADLKTCIKLAIQKDELLNRYSKFIQLLNQRDEHNSAITIANLYKELNEYITNLLPNLLPAAAITVQAKAKNDFETLLTNTPLPTIPNMNTTIPKRPPMSGTSPAAYCATIAEILISAGKPFVERAIAAIMGEHSGYMSVGRSVPGHLVNLLSVGIAQAVPHDVAPNPNLISDTVGSIVLSRDVDGDDTIASNADGLLQTFGNQLMFTVAPTSRGGGKRGYTRRNHRNNYSKSQRGGGPENEYTPLAMLFFNELLNTVERLEFTTEKNPIPDPHQYKPINIIYESFDTEYYEKFITWAIQLYNRYKKDPAMFIQIVLFDIPKYYDVNAVIPPPPYFIGKQIALHTVGLMNGPLPRPANYTYDLTTLDGIVINKNTTLDTRIRSYRHSIETIFKYFHTLYDEDVSYHLYVPPTRFGSILKSPESRGRSPLRSERSPLKSGLDNHGLHSIVRRSSHSRSRRRSIRPIYSVLQSPETSLKGTGNSYGGYRKTQKRSQRRNPKRGKTRKQKRS